MMPGVCGWFILLTLALELALSLPTEQLANSFYIQAMGSPADEQLSQHRYRRQVLQTWQIDPNRQVWINNAFQIPIQTLQAVSNLLQSTRPLVARPMVATAAASSAQPQQYPNYQQYPYYQQNPQGPKRKSRNRPTVAAKVTGLYKPAKDGSSFKI